MGISLLIYAIFLSPFFSGTQLGRKRISWCIHHCAVVQAHKECLMMLQHILNDIQHL